MDKHAFHELHDRYRTRLLYIMTAIVKNREEAEDITSVAFIRAFENWHSFRGEPSLYSWLYAIALNKARQSLRQKRVMSLEALGTREPITLVEPDRPAQALERSECRCQLREALRRIPTLYRCTLLDHFTRGYSVKQIAPRRGVPVGTVLSRILTAKQILRRAWEA